MASSPRGGERLSSLLVVTQVACAVVLVVGAGLMFRTIENVNRIPLGLDPDGVVALSVNGQKFDFAARVLDRVRHAPGVEAAAVAGGLTFSVYGSERLASAAGVALPCALATGTEAMAAFTDKLARLVCALHGGEKPSGNKTMGRSKRPKGYAGSRVLSILTCLWISCDGNV